LGDAPADRPKPLIEPTTLKSTSDWIEAGRRVFDELDHLPIRTFTRPINHAVGLLLITHKFDPGLPDALDVE
jgi:hypothetical protein